MKGKERAAIRRLRAGIVPSWALERLSVAYEEIKVHVDRSLEGVLAQEQIGALFVEGEWGVGKTHFLSYVQASARSLGIPCAMVNLDAYSFALNYPQRFYTTVAERLVVEEHIGLRAVITHLIFDEKTRDTLSTFAASPDSGDISFALSTLCQCALQGEDALAREQYAWTVLLGLDLNWANYGYKRRAAVARLATLARMFGAVGLGGIVILFDEAETIDQLWNIRSRITAYATMGSMCQSPGLWAIFGITKRFNRTISGDIDRLGWPGPTLDMNAEWFLSKWKSGDFLVMNPPPIDKTLAPVVAERVAQLYRDAHEVGIDNAMIDQALAEWSKNPTRNPRRLIRGVVDRIDRFRSVAAH